MQDQAGQAMFSYMYMHLIFMYLALLTHSNLFYRHVIGTVKGVVLVVLLVILLVEEFKSIYVD